VTTKKAAVTAKAFRVLPVTPSRWNDLVRLFGERGACGGCWCMTPRLSNSEYERQKGDGNRRALRRLVNSGRPPGLLAYLGSEPVAWISIEPREAFARLARSRVAAPVDDRPVWSIVCIFVAKSHRRRGVSVRLIREAVSYARSRGATCVEAYPVNPKKPDMADVFAWHGLASAYLEAGFREVARRSETRSVMRRNLRPGRKGGNAGAAARAGGRPTGSTRTARPRRGR
jgi:GNAT superfamily N-acetyltransferase